MDYTRCTQIAVVACKWLKICIVIVIIPNISVLIKQFIPIVLILEQFDVENFSLPAYMVLTFSWSTWKLNVNYTYEDHSETFLDTQIFLKSNLQKFRSILTILLHLQCTAVSKFSKKYFQKNPFILKTSIKKCIYNRMNFIFVTKKKST